MRATHSSGSKDIAETEICAQSRLIALYRINSDIHSRQKKAYLICQPFQPPTNPLGNNLKLKKFIRTMFQITIKKNLLSSINIRIFLGVGWMLGWQAKGIHAKWPVEQPIALTRGLGQRG